MGVIPRILFMALACVSVTACMLQSENPLSDPAQAVRDHRLDGIWHGVMDGEEVYLHVGHTEDQFHNVIAVVHKENRNIESERYSLFVTVLGDHRFMNVITLEPKHVDGYVFIRYDITDDRDLMLWWVDYESLREAVERQEIGGEIVTGALIDKVILTDDTPALAEFFGSYDRISFVALGRFKRIQ